MSSIQDVIQYISRYGIIIVFILMYLEQLNFPGLSATLILPALGVIIARYDYKFISMFIVSLLGAILGSLTLYLIGYFIGQPILQWISRKIPKIELTINKIMIYCDKYGSKGVFICRFIPGVRTLISLVSGSVREGLFEFMIYSSLGIGVWNLVFMMSGYLTTSIIIK